jgi:sarcosine oxidase subunit beta
MTGTEAGEAALRAGYELQRSLGVGTEWLSPADVPERAALVRTAGLRAATFHQRDGFLDPHGVVAALKEDAQARGATIATRRAIRSIERQGDEFLVRAEGDDLIASWVVNAAGSHARSVAAMLGVDIPVDPVRRNLAFIPDPDGSELIPMCVDLDTGVLVRRETGGGYVIAYSDPGDAPGWDTTLDPLFLEQVAERIGNRFPSLATIPIDPRHCWAGLYPETPDHHAVVGPAPDNERFVQCVGFGGHGIMHAPAAGKAIAEIITTGKCTTFDLHALRVERFAEGDLVVETAVL